MKHRTGRYRVVGKLPYRGHPPGATFTASLDPRAEERGLARGNITLLERIVPSIQPGSFTLPVGWVTKQEEEGSG